MIRLVKAHSVFPSRGIFSAALGGEDLKQLRR